MVLKDLEVAQKDTGKSKKTVEKRDQNASALPPGRTPDKTASDSALSSTDRSEDGGASMPQNTPSTAPINVAASSGDETTRADDKFVEDHDSKPDHVKEVDDALMASRRVSAVNLSPAVPDANALPAGKIMWDGVAGWYFNTGVLKVGLSGNVDQTCLDSKEGINKKTWTIFGFTFSAKAQAWKWINKALGTSVPSDTNLTFMPAIVDTKAEFKSDTLLSVPVLIANEAGTDDPEVDILTGDKGTVELSGQIIFGSGFLNVYITSGTLTIDRAFVITGDFYIQPKGSYSFKGQEPDTTASAAGRSVKEADVHYDNGNADGHKLWAQVLNGSTVYLEGGSATTSDTGVIVLNANARLKIDVESVMSGNYVIGWDNNTVEANARFVLTSGARVVASTNVDLGKFGFSGDGNLVITGDFWNGSSWQTSAVDFSDGATIGNLTIGYNPFFDQGIGSAQTVLGDASLKNLHARYGATAALSGTIKLSGNFFIGGGDDSTGEVDLAKDATLARPDGNEKGSVEIVNSLGVLKLEDSAKMNVPLKMDDGTVTCGDSDYFSDVNMLGGHFTCGKNDSFGSLTISGGTFDGTPSAAEDNILTVDKLTLTGGLLNAAYAYFKGETAVSGGTLSATSMKCDSALNVSGSGAVKLSGGTLADVTINSSGNSTIGASFTSLQLASGNTGTTTLTGADLPGLTVAGGTLKFSAQNVAVTSLSISGGHVTSDHNVTVNNLAVTNGDVKCAILKVGQSFSVSGGIVTADEIEYTADTLAITGSGAINLSNGVLKTVTVNSSADSTLGANITSLTLQTGDEGTVTLTGGTIETVTQQDGILDVTRTVTVKTLDISGGTTSISGTLVLSDSTVTIGKDANVTLDGGTLTFNHAGTYDMNGAFNVSKNGGRIDLGGSLAELNIKKGFDVKGALDIEGSGVVSLYGNVTGSDDADVINVHAGTTLMIMKDAVIKPKILMEAGSRISFEDTASASATIVCSDDAAQKGGVLHFADGGTTGLVEHINVTIENFKDGVQLDFDALHENGATFEKAYYLDGKIHVFYKETNQTTSKVEEHEIILEHVLGKNLYNNEALNASVLPDGTMTWDDARKWYFGLDSLKIKLSGRIDQKCLDSEHKGDSGGVNKMYWSTFGWHAYAREQAWNQVNDVLGTSYSRATNFDFLPIVKHIEVSYFNQMSTDMTVPILVASGNTSNNPIIKIDVSDKYSVTLSGQIIYGAGFLNVQITSGTLSISHAFCVKGDFYIYKSGIYHFSGGKPDTSASAAGRSVKESDVQYFNDNSGGNKLWAQILNGSTVYMEGGRAETGESGVIVLNSQARLKIEAESTLSGNYVIGWDYNTVEVSAKFILDSDAKIVASAAIDLGKYGYSGDGHVAVSGNYWDGSSNSWKTSSISFSDGASIGNLTVGYNPYYDQGLGSSKTAFGNTTRTNDQPRFGGLGTLAGSITLTGVISIGGGDNVSGEVDLSQNARISRPDNNDTGSIDVANNLGILKLADSVTLSVPLIVEDGKVTCGASDNISSLTLSGGTFTANSGTSESNQLTLATISQSGGSFDASWVKVTGDAAVSGGKFSASHVACNGALKVTGSGVVQLYNGSLGDVTISSSGDSSISASFTSLELLKDNSGTTSLGGSALSTISVAGGNLKLTADNVTVTTLTVSGGAVIDDNKSINVDTLNVSGGTLTFDGLVVTTKFTVTGGSVTVNTIKYTHDVLAISGSGQVDLKKGTLGAVTVNSSADSTFGTDMTSLTLLKGDTGTVTLNGGTIDKLTQADGTISVTDAVTVKALDLTGGTTKISGTLTFDGTSLIATPDASSDASIDFDGGSIVLKQNGSFSIGSKISVSSKGGTIDFGQSKAELDISGDMSVSGALDLKGDGVVKLFGTVTGGVTKDVINVGAGTTLMIMDGADISPMIKVAASGIVKLENGSLCTATVEISDEAAKLGCTIGFEEAIDPTQMETHIRVGIKNFGDGVKLDVEGLKQEGMTVKRAYYEAGKIHILYETASKSANARSSGLQELIFDHVSGKNLKDGQDLTVNPDGHGGTNIETCFLSGTRIKTPQGWRPVEELAPGDLVITYEDGAEVAAPVRWVGEGDVTCRADLPGDLAGYAVRIVKDAFGPGAPFEDVLVTSEHCVFVDGGLIPVRMLVNGGSIAYERELPTYRFHHFETEKHAIVSAAGLAVETYLDTGNRARFSAGHGVVGLRPKTVSALAAPLFVTREQVEPVCARLAGLDVCRERLVALPAAARAGAGVTMDADFHLLLPNGMALWPVSHREGGYVFNLPKDVDAVCLASRASRPCDVIGPYVDDRRVLGVLVGAVHLIGPQHIMEVTHHFTDDAPGWHGVEHPAARWTDGCAVLKLPSSEERGNFDFSLQIKLLQEGPYLTVTKADVTRPETAAA
ncbi:Hint domain-containing protein [Candidatus Kirkpatrickella diaphorinae]|uniref:Hint domain-containing protein n=1 Tax=Candidatus Kirkpatrickella diaphorinae TaxID=2984322 RepID=A0ABY6GGI9_9PROT|nr:Hint domain-containing protein [Candidatus Kirkpatrickella diaphorinae]UYH50621.1 Hint domain-containing protein [Candidatus Kirkpatrickella diaphorinae]